MFVFTINIIQRIHFILTKKYASFVGKFDIKSHLGNNIMINKFIVFYSTIFAIKFKDPKELQIET